ncbi:methyltransferase [Actinacidiphila glaucinigra]|uniref:methyltransferase n=1 Tax=Actinacidiphila glaucinigra TaxID=235986 RepID=UPI0037CA61A4
MILHDWDEETGRRLLDKCWAALPDGGAVIICELVLDDDETGPAPAALMGLNMLVETRSGHNYTYGEYRRWLADAGFTATTVVPLDAAGANAAIVAHKRAYPPHEEAARIRGSARPLPPRWVKPTPPGRPHVVETLQDRQANFVPGKAGSHGGAAADWQHVVTEPAAVPPPCRPTQGLPA